MYSVDQLVRRRYLLLILGVWWGTSSGDGDEITWDRDGLGGSIGFSIICVGV